MTAASVTLSGNMHVSYKLHVLVCVFSLILGMPSCLLDRDLRVVDPMDHVDLGQKGLLVLLTITLILSMQVTSS